MAVQRKNAKQDEVEVKEVVKEEVPVEDIVKEEKPQKKVRKEIDRNEMIPCLSVSDGEVTYISKKTGLTTKWGEYGATEYLDVAELLTMKSQQPRFLTEPWIVIEDDDVAEFLGLDKIYANIIDLDELEVFFRLPPHEIEEKLKQVPKGTKDLIAGKAREYVASDVLYDMRVIRVLDKALNIDLAMVQN
ncbi:hypothetical protein M5X17_27425 [Paenibacillus alvei]|uniref:hypothetical protein n=1 Tax=Paenibacillus alvei TaxID=44250 RepID=UPI00227F610A|nr:hypothetical protein [Paenibacillus alvei]MCY9737436.1 hypothetical protein [Paenibacillus alvei]